MKGKVPLFMLKKVLMKIVFIIHFEESTSENGGDSFPLRMYELCK